MLPTNPFDRRFLTQHNIGASPVKNITPSSSPHVTPTKGSAYGDRYIPLRSNASDWNTRFAAIPTVAEYDGSNQYKRPNARDISGRNTTNSASTSSHTQSSPNSNCANSNGEEPRQDQMVIKALLRNELLHDCIDDIRSCYRTEYDVNSHQSGSGAAGAAASSSSANGGVASTTPPGSGGHEMRVTREPTSASLFTYSTPTKISPARGLECASTSSPLSGSLFSGPLSADSQRLLRSPRKPQRKVPKNPYKVLDAPELQDDFYLNLVDWSAQNMLSVGLNTCVYLWSAMNSQVVKLCDLQTENDTVTSVQWTDKGDALAVGTNKGNLQIWDVHTQKKVHELTGHTSRIGCLAWNGDLICSGSRDRYILQRDIRQPNIERRLSYHRQEVCGLKWSPDRQCLASGGNDNQLLVWNLRRNEPYQVYTDHSAAVKALAWSPHHHGLLVSGGGTADRCLRFWNTLTAQSMQCIDTGSQVCNVAWSKHSSELVSTHGYSFNQVIIWKYPSLQPVTKLTGHQFRVLYLAMSPDGESIVTGAGDETLRFWHVFCKQGQAKTTRSKLNLFTSIR